MKSKGVAFFYIVILAFALMALIVITQYFTNKSTKALNVGNREAVTTYKINNGIQELVNLSFDLESKFKSPNFSIKKDSVKSIRDSLTMYGYNASILTSITAKGSAHLSATINNIVDSQINISQNILDALQKNNIPRKKILVDSLQHLKPGDKVYNNSIALQRLLKDNLQETLTKNSEQAGKLSMYNRILAMFAIIAILLMATIIIRRQSQQLKLIEELRFAETAALKSKNAKDEFLANMSHELRTPLTALIGFGNLLYETKLSKEQNDYVEMIRSGGYNLLNIVNDVLDLSKIEAGKLTIAHRPFNIYELFQKIEKLFFNNLKQKELAYSSSIDDSIPVNVIGDPDRLQQILVNLIGNAIKFTNQGGITVTAGIVWIDEEKKYYKLGFTVRDTGTGIPREKIGTIFERFEQLEHGTQRLHGGTGLGLTIVKNLVEKMGGAISVYSQLNEGSEFNFTCILEKANDIMSEKNKSEVAEILFDGSKVLLVEDNKANQVLLKHIFGKYHIEPQIIDNGADAVATLKKEHFDLVFMDIQMPVMDGYDAINELRNQLKITDPVIAMTAYVTEIEIEKCQKAGFTDYIAKPIDEALLLQKLSKYLVSKQQQFQERKINLDFLKDIFGDNTAAMAEILREMNLQWNTDKKDLTKACSESDHKQISNVLHRLKSTFSFLGGNHKIYKIVLEEGPTLLKENISLNECSRFIQKIEHEISYSLNDPSFERTDIIQ